jgi:surface protein
MFEWFIPVTSGGLTGLSGMSGLVGSGVDPTLFITEWKTDNAGVSNSVQVKLPLVSTGTYDFEVDWGDNTTSTINTWNDPNTTHTYSSSGTYEVIIDGTLNGFRFNNGGDKSKLIDIKQWGSVLLGNYTGTFFGCDKLEATATDAPNTIAFTNMSLMFTFCALYNGKMDTWNVSNVLNFQNMFNGATIFNEDITSWDVSSVTNFNLTFNNCENFDQEIGSWDVSSGTNFGSMFSGASNFSGDLSSWNTSSAVIMAVMFSGASSFNSNINSWDVRKVQNFSNMFSGAGSFNSPLNSWNTAAATNMSFMFNVANTFNQPVNTFDTSSVTLMQRMFYFALNFDQDISGFDVSNVTNMEDMLQGSAFSQTNYDLLLPAWEAQSVQNSVNFHAGSAKYGAGAPASARAALIADHSWTITDGGPA